MYDHDTLLLEGIYMDILESRKNPEQNPKTFINDMYEKYKDDPNIFISFVNNLSPDGKYDVNFSGEKIGINPSSTFNTPNGIYSYPLKYMIDHYSLMDNDGNIKDVKIPYAGSRPNIFVLRRTDSGKHLNISELDIEDYKENIDKSCRYFASILDNINNQELKLYFIEDAINNAKIDSLGGKLWNITRYFASLYYHIKKNNNDLNVNDLKDLSTKYNTGDLRYSPNFWNKLLRDVLGYDSVVDYGKGIIHPSEPEQCVFFSTRGFKIVDVVRNTSKPDWRILIKNEIDPLLKKYEFTGPIGNKHSSLEVYYIHKTHRNLKIILTPHTFLVTINNEPITNKEIEDLELKHQDILFCDSLGKAIKYLKNFLNNDLDKVIKYISDNISDDRNYVYEIAEKYNLKISYSKVDNTPEIRREYVKDGNKIKLIIFSQDDELIVQLIKEGSIYTRFNMHAMASISTSNDPLHDAFAKMDYKINTYIKNNKDDINYNPYVEMVKESFEMIKQRVFRGN